MCFILELEKWTLPHGHTGNRVSARARPQTQVWVTTKPNFLFAVPGSSQQCWTVTLRPESLGQAHLLPRAVRVGGKTSLPILGLSPLSFPEHMFHTRFFNYIF